jgi:hypothetical protein
MTVKGQRGGAGKRGMLLREDDNGHGEAYDDSIVDAADNDDDDAGDDDDGHHPPQMQHWPHLHAHAEQRPVTGVTERAARVFRWPGKRSGPGKGGEG